MNPEHPDSTFPINVERWKSREELRREYLDSLSPEELRQVNPADYWVKYGLPAWQREPARKYDPDQPRVPPGNPDGGQWTVSQKRSTCEAARSPDIAVGRPIACGVAARHNDH